MMRKNKSFIRFAPPNRPNRKHYSGEISAQSSDDSLSDDSASRKLPTHADQIPIFIIPGIFGHSIECQSLKQELHVKFPEAFIYVYQDLRYSLKQEPDNNSPRGHIYTSHHDNSITINSFVSLWEHAKFIGREIRSVIPGCEVTPIEIFAYSFGCVLGTLVAIYLKSKGIKIYLHLIDSPSPQSWQQRFIKLPERMLEEVVGIINAVAEINEFTPVFNYQEIDEAEAIRVRMLTLQSSEKDLRKLLNEFATLIPIFVKCLLDDIGANKQISKMSAIITENIQNLLEFNIGSIKKPGKKIKKLEEAVFISTTNTREKFENLHQDWELYIERLLEQENNLSSTSHTQLLSKKNVISLVSYLTSNTFSTPPYDYMVNIWLEKARKTLIGNHASILAEIKIKKRIFSFFQRTQVLPSSFFQQEGPENTRYKNSSN